MKRSAYLKEPYLSEKYRKAKLRSPHVKWRVMMAGKKINVPESVRKFKALADPGAKLPTRSVPK